MSQKKKKCTSQSKTKEDVTSQAGTWTHNLQAGNKEMSEEILSLAAKCDRWMWNNIQTEIWEKKGWRCGWHETWKDKGQWQMFRETCTFGRIVRWGQFWVLWNTRGMYIHCLGSSNWVKKIAMILTMLVMFLTTHLYWVKLCVWAMKIHGNS